MFMHPPSERTRKIILWTAIVILGVALFAWWGKGVGERMQNLSWPQVPEELKKEVEQGTKSLQLPVFDFEAPPELQEQLQEELDNAKQQKEQQQ